MENSSKKAFKQAEIAYLLRKLYFVSHEFSSNEYEDYICATYYYIVFKCGRYLTNDAKNAYNALFLLAHKYMFRPVLYDDTRFYSIIDKYYSVNI